MGSLGGILETSWAVLAKFFSRLGPQLGSILDPKMALELPKSRPRGAYRTPKRPLGAKNHPKAAQSPPKPPRELPRPPLSLDFRGSTVAGTRLCRAEDPHRARRRPDACQGPQHSASAFTLYTHPLHFSSTFTLYTHPDTLIFIYTHNQHMQI